MMNDWTVTQTMQSFSNTVDSHLMQELIQLESCKIALEKMLVTYVFIFHTL